MVAPSLLFNHNTFIAAYGQDFSFVLVYSEDGSLCIVGQKKTFRFLWICPAWMFDSMTKVCELRKWPAHNINFYQGF